MSKDTRAESRFPESPTDYREILNAELEHRRRNNRLYSLRAFARDLGLAPSTLSEVLRGQHGLSRRLASTVADRLGFTQKEKSIFCTLVQSDLSARRKRRGSSDHPAPASAEEHLARAAAELDRRRSELGRLFGKDLVTAETFVVDNGSSDPAREKIHGFAQRLESEIARQASSDKHFGMALSLFRLNGRRR